MRHVFSLGVLLLGIAASAHADYYRFIYVPGVGNGNFVPGNGVVGGQPGGLRGVAGGNIGVPGGNIGGIQPGGLRGIPGGNIGVGGNVGGIPPGNLRGVPPGANIGFPGANIGVPGGNIGGMPPGNKGPGTKGQPEPEPSIEDEVDWTNARCVVVEVKTTAKPKRIPVLNSYFIEHKWGYTALAQTDEIKWVRLTENRRPIKTVAERYSDLRKGLIKNEKDTPTPDALIELAEYALSHGLMDKFHQDMTDLLKVKPDNRKAQLYKKYQAELKISPKKPDMGVYWKERLGNFKITTSEHFVALFDSPTNDSIEVKNRLKQLEDSYQAFYYWFAMRGKYVKPPERRQLVVMVDDPKNFYELHKAFDEQPLAADGFYSRRENLSVLCNTSLDEVYDALTKSTKDMWVNEGYSRDVLLKGKWSPGKDPQSVANAQEMALVMKVLQEESELATVTHLTGRQLAAASGLLPHNVASPEWIQYGVGSVFETPKGSYWAGTGGPHFKHLVTFKLARDIQKIDKADLALRRVVTDSYFRTALASKDPAALQKAQMMSWALTYFLAQQNQLDGLLKFFDELAALPRDLECDENVYLGCFARAFDLADPSKPDGLSADRMAAFAKDWYVFMKNVQLEIADPYDVARKTEEYRIRKEAEMAKNPPGGPGGVGPGGVGPGGVRPPGQFPPGQFPPGQFPPGQIPPGGKIPPPPGR